MEWITPFWWPSLAAEIPETFGATGLELITCKTRPGDNQRSEVRKFLASRWSSEFESEDEIFDLSRRPTGKEMSFSVSHCPGHIGILSIPKNSRCTVGLDIEVIARVEMEIAGRVSDGEETLEAPSAAYLWTAKECFYKAIPDERQPTTISQIKVSDWKQIADSLWSFRARTRSTEGAGLGILNDELIYATAFIAKA